MICKSVHVFAGAGVISQSASGTNRIRVQIDTLFNNCIPFMCACRQQEVKWPKTLKCRGFFTFIGMNREPSLNCEWIMRKRNIINVNLKKQSSHFHSMKRPKLDYIGCGAKVSYYSSVLLFPKMIKCHPFAL